MGVVANITENRASIFTDINSLNHIREKAKVDSSAAIKSAAKEFEAFFMNMMLKSMRQASEAMGDDSMFSSPQEKMFIGMLDEQMSVELSQKGNLGIADLMVRDILGEQSVNQSVNEMVSKAATKIVNTPVQVVARASTSIQYPKLDINKINSSIEEPRQVAEFIGSTSEIESPQKTTAEYLHSIVTPIKKAIFDSAQSFVETLVPLAKTMAEKLGVDPRVLLAQSALETGWGKYVMHNDHGLSSNNLFGIKTNPNWQGEKVTSDTLEVENGELVKRKDEFRAYSDFEQSFSDYVDFIKQNPRYQKALQAVQDSKEYLQQLQSAGYATDPNYASKILKIFDRDIIQNALGQNGSHRTSTEIVQ